MFGGAFLIGGTGFGFAGQQFIASGVAAIIFSFSPIVTGLFAWILLPEARLVGRDYLGVILGFLGVGIIVRPAPEALLGPDVVGKLLVFAAVVTVALGFVLYLTLIGTVGALRANLVTYLTPVVALVVGWLVLEETVRPGTLLGFLLIVAGFALLESRELSGELAKYRGLFR